MRVTCTCGCGQQVTYATKLSHLNGHGKTSLRAKVLQENESLKPSTRRQPVLLQDDQKKKRSHPSSNQTGNRKRLKADRLDVDLPAQAHADPIESLPTPVPNQGPESPIQAYTDPTELPLTSVSQADAGPEELPLALEPDGIEDGSADALSSARRLNEITERTRGVTEQRWGNSHLRDEIPKSDSGGGGFWSEDEEEVDLNMTGDEDSDGEDSDDEDSDDEGREEDDDNLFAESGVTGISAWDLLGKDFEREVASIGMFLAQDSSVLLTIF